MKTYKCIPNKYPYNELLLSGKLSAKTRSWKWNFAGTVLLYTSSSMHKEVVFAHGLPFDFNKCVIVGFGELLPVRENTDAELMQIEDEFGTTDIMALPYRYEFKNLRRFKKPIPFKPPKGAVSVFNVPAKLVDVAMRNANAQST